MNNLGGKSAVFHELMLVPMNRRVARAAAC